MRWVCNLQPLSSTGSLIPEIFSSSEGCKPVGWMNEELNFWWVAGWWREGKEKRVAEGLVCSPSTVRKPPRESSSSSVDGETERMPISRREVGK